MKLKTFLPSPEQAKAMPALYADEATPAEQKLAIAKWFNPTGAGTWYAVEAYAILGDGTEVALGSIKMPAAWGDGDGDVADIRCFGWVTLGLGPDCDEWGYFSLRELSEIKGRFGLGIERDLHWGPGPIPELQDPTPWCSGCRAKRRQDCHCGPIASNE